MPNPIRLVSALLGRLLKLVMLQWLCLIPLAVREFADVEMFLKPEMRSHVSKSGVSSVGLAGSISSSATPMWTIHAKGQSSTVSSERQNRVGVVRLRYPLAIEVELAGDFIASIVAAQPVAFWRAHK